MLSGGGEKGRAASQAGGAAKTGGDEASGMVHGFFKALAQG